MAGIAARRAFMLLGDCVPTLIPGTSKIRVKRLELDQNLLMYFKKEEFYYVQDTEKKCKTGDVVLIQELPRKLTTAITHKVMEVVYPFGDVTDPITSEKVVVGKYRSVMDEHTKLYGPSKTRFDYEKAKERGWLEDVKDFTHEESYIKYHESDEDQPYAV
ncbi:28S ribosomal protein S17, mitochondrial [Ischnura elegans]|uniref:28S ribosomal protein S17, mitochondrial n=1 Tax=Ischnura elegans TaxID=197161 RepID=UPI001ED88D53|nr:28S ribosomal protein S17, mitochondrial [Ischnura elegans]XP_046395290.1 28S ribosomal protein S17, mitochondrial [Ischnura elegans]